MKDQNQLYPVFLKVTQIKVLIVGGGNVGLEKLTFLLKSSPEAEVKVVSKEFLPELKKLSENHSVSLIEKTYEESDVVGNQIIIAATNNYEVNKEIHGHAKKYSILVNVADTPALCDFYMGGIVTKGNVKIAISTNGKSPTVAKRLRQYFEEVIPDEINHLIENLSVIRASISGGFSQKVKELNEITDYLIKEPKQ